MWNSSKQHNTIQHNTIQYDTTWWHYEITCKNHPNKLLSNHPVDTGSLGPTSSPGFWHLDNLHDQQNHCWSLFHNQCFFHTLSFISSIGIHLVSGRNTYAKVPITTIQTAKKNIPDLKWHNIVRKAWAMMKVQIMFMLTVKKNPAVLVSNG